MEAAGNKGLHFSLLSLFEHAKQVETREKRMYLTQTYKEEWAPCSMAFRWSEIFTFLDFCNHENQASLFACDFKLHFSVGFICWRMTNDLQKPT